MKPLTFGSLFAGIGGFDLGFERAGMKCVFQVEINEFCRKVLAKHWPNVERFNDVKEFPPGGVQFSGGRRGGDDLRALEAVEGPGGVDPRLERFRVDVICGGFPCQDISFAGRGEGIDGERSGLWAEFSRIVCLLRPRYVVVENVPALLARGLGRVLGNLATSGFDAVWDCLPAAAFGAPHIRDRLFIVGTRDRSHSDIGRLWVQGRGAPEGEEGRDQEAGGQRQRVRADAEPVGEDVADTSGERQYRRSGIEGTWREETEWGETVHHVGDGCKARFDGGCCWDSEPAVGRVADGVPNRVDRLRGLGNAVVPQVAEWIGRRLIEASNTKEDTTNV